MSNFYKKIMRDKDFFDNYYKSKKNQITRIISKRRFNSFILTTIPFFIAGCNATKNEKCYGGLGLIVGTVCANSNSSNIIKLETVDTQNDYFLTPELDLIEFINSKNVFSDRYNLTSGDIIKNADKFNIDLINVGSGFIGQKIYDTNEINISSKGNNVILTSDWYNNKKITISSIDNDLILNDLQSTKLNSTIAPDGQYYPGTIYILENINSPNSKIEFNFNPLALNGSSTEVKFDIIDSNFSLIGDFYNPSTVPPAEPPASTNPYNIPTDTNIESVILNVKGNVTLKDLNFLGLESLEILGENSNKNFKILSPLNTTLEKIYAQSTSTNLDLNFSNADVLIEKEVYLGSGDDIINVGNSLVDSLNSDFFSGGNGNDILLINIQEEKNIAPTIEDFETIEISVNANSNFDFSNISNLEKLKISDSTSGINLQNLPFDLSSFVVLGNQNGDWNLNYSDNSSADPIINWNNSKIDTSLTSLAFDEINSISIVSNGSKNVDIESLNLDDNDTTSLNLSNNNDGNFLLSTSSSINSSSSIKNINIVTNEGGNIQLGSVQNTFGFEKLEDLNNLILSSSVSGDIELGPIGTVNMIQDFQNLDLVSKGADISLGAIKANNVGDFRLSIFGNSQLSLGDLEFLNPGKKFFAQGEGSINQINFLKESFDMIDISNLSQPSSINFSNAENGVKFFGSSNIDEVTFGNGKDIVFGNNGADIFIIGNDKTGNNLSNADVIEDFVSGEDKLKLGLAGNNNLTTGNYVESSTQVSDFQDALSAANLALSQINATSEALKLYSFQFDSNNGYLFIDINSDGIAENLILLSNIENSDISHLDIIS